MKIVMTLLVRNAEALLRHNIEFHLGQGVDFFIITDNLSTDATAEIASEYVARGLAQLIVEHDDTFSQGVWVTRMARIAADCHRADWVVNSDDDEFWSSDLGSLQAVLSSIPEDVEAVSVQRVNHVTVAGTGKESFIQDMIYREILSSNAFGQHLPDKVCHRASGDIVVAEGNHGVSRDGAALAAQSAQGIRIHHFPIRDYESFERKIALGGAAYLRNNQVPLGIGATWRFLYDLLQQGKLRAWYDRQVLTPDELAGRLANASLIYDDTVDRVLRTRQAGHAST